MEVSKSNEWKDVELVEPWKECEERYMSDEETKKNEQKGIIFFLIAVVILIMFIIFY